MYRLGAFVSILSIVLLMASAIWAIETTFSCSSLIIYYGAGEKVTYDKTNYLNVVELYYSEDRLAAVKVGLSNGSWITFFQVTRIDVLADQFDQGWDNPKLAFVRKSIESLMIPQ